MKKVLITSIVATPVITLGVLMGISSLENKPTPIKEHVVIEASAKEAEVISNTSVTTPETPTEPTYVEDENAPITPEAAHTEPPVNLEEEKYQAVSQYILDNSPAGTYGTIRVAFLTNREAFYKDKEAALNICVEVINDRVTINKQVEIQKRLAQL